MKDDNTFINDMEVKLDYWKHEIMKFRIIAEVAEPDAQIEHYKIIENLVKSEEAIIEMIAEYKESQAVDRTSLKNEITVRRETLDDALEAARFKIN